MCRARTATAETPFSISIPYAFQESTFQFGGAGQANMNKGGLLYNVISRSGTNQLHGGATFNGIEQHDEFGEHQRVS